MTKRNEKPKSPSLLPQDLKTEFSEKNAFSDPIFSNPYDDMGDKTGYTERTINGRKLGFVDGLPLVTAHGVHIILSKPEE